MEENNNTLKIIDPPFDSNLTDLIIELDYLRKKELFGSTTPQIFFQIKEIFHLMESIGSARIEGNHTTVAEFIDSQISAPENVSDSFQEILNMEKALEFIEANIENRPISRMFISELHKLTVDGLKREGSSNPGDFRFNLNPLITGSKHRPPDYTQVQSYMDELISFINEPNSPKYDLLKTAVVHHRFAWIHPFDNGNGRTSRLLTYSMLVKQGFNIHEGRIINPTAVFCSNRDLYYEALSHADSETDQGLLYWCEYMLKGLKGEIEKIDKLLDYRFLSARILLPALKLAKERYIINPVEFKILSSAIDKQIIDASDVKNILPGKNPAVISRKIKELRDRKLLRPLKKGKRKYHIRFMNNVLTRCIFNLLDKEGFLPYREDF